MAFLRIVNEIVQEEKPELFTNQNRSRPGAVASGGAKPNGESLEAFKRGLSREDHDFMVLALREKWFASETEFMNQYKELS
jgi:hypothetical protein